MIRSRYRPPLARSRRPGRPAKASPCYASGVGFSNRTPGGALASFALVVFMIRCGESRSARSDEEPDGSATQVRDAQVAPRLVPEVVGDFLKAWGTPDATERAALLEGSFAPDAVYTDPVQSADGRDELDALMTRLQGGIPGATIVATTRIDLLRGRFRYGWQIVAGDGTVRQTGEDEGTASPGGIIQRITGFFDPPSSSATPAGLEALVRALAAPNRTTLETDLATSVTDDVVWTDRSGQAVGLPALVDHLVTLLSPGSGTKFELAGSADAYGDYFRMRVSVAGGYAAQYGQLFGHSASDGRLDSVTYFDSELTN